MQNFPIEVMMESASLTTTCIIILHFIILPFHVALKSEILSIVKLSVLSKNWIFNET